MAKANKRRGRAASGNDGSESANGTNESGNLPGDEPVRITDKQTQRMLEKQSTIKAAKEQKQQNLRLCREGENDL